MVIGAGIGRDSRRGRPCRRRVSTSGKLRRMRSWRWSCRFASSIEMFGKRDRHVEQVALVERRHELVPELACASGHRRRQREEPDRDASTSAAGARRTRTARRGGSMKRETGCSLLGRDLAADEQVLQRRRERDRQQRRDQHHERLRVGERLEEAPGLAGEREDRQERHRDDEQREEDRRRHLLGRLDQERVPVARRGPACSSFLCAGLDHHDLGVDGGADRDGDAAQAHDRRRDVEQHHRE